MSAYDLLVIGEINADLILTGRDLVPEFGQVEKLVDSGLLTLGGSSVITACGAARLGLQTAFLGIVGDDALGHFMLEGMVARSVDVSLCTVDRAVQTGISAILSPSGASERRAILTAPGSISALRPEHIDRSLLHRTRHVHSGGYYLQPQLHGVLAEFFAEARSYAATCSVDPNWDPSGRWNANLSSVLRECDVFLPNGTEAQRISDTDEVEIAIRRVAPATQTVAVKLGEEGAWARSNGHLTRGKAPAVAVTDTTGAGDSFDAGFLYGYLHGWNCRKSLQLALACGSLSTRAVGGTTAQPTLEEALSVAETIEIIEA